MTFRAFKVSWAILGSPKAREAVLRSAIIWDRTDSSLIWVSLKLITSKTPRKPQAVRSEMVLMIITITLILLVIEKSLNAVMVPFTIYRR